MTMKKLTVISKNRGAIFTRQKIFSKFSGDKHNNFELNLIIRFE